jgi:sugar lactone lactonase YvrE
MRLGPDGGLYVASAFGSTVVRIDLERGDWTTVCCAADGIVSPDDLTFIGSTLYVAECMNARVSAWNDGHARVVTDLLPGANGIDALDNRLFVDQFLPEGKLWEIFADGGPPRLLADGLAGPNGLCASRDGFVYFVQVFTGEVMRVPIDGGDVELVAGGLSAPSSVRVGPEGRIYVSQGGSGEVSIINPRTREVRSFGRSRPGIDNLAVDSAGRVFISYYIDGAVYELSPTNALRELMPPGLLGPYGIAVNDAGVYIADGLSAASLASDGQLSPAGKFTDPGFPGYARGLAAGSGSELVVTTSEGRVARYDPVHVSSELLVEGLAEPMGVDRRADGSIVVAEAGSGRVVAIAADGSLEVLDTNFERPVGIAFDRDGQILVSDEARGTVERLGGEPRVLLDGLDHPHDIAITANGILVVEAGARRLLRIPADGGRGCTVASNLPIGTSDGPRPTLGGLPEMIPGPISPFAGLAVDNRGQVYVGGDGSGVVSVLHASSGAGLAEAPLEHHRAESDVEQWPWT